MARCTMCGDLGWILDCNDLGKPGPRQAELLPCLIPDCAASGQPLQSITFGHSSARFATATRHPSEGWIKAVRNPMAQRLVRPEACTLGPTADGD